MTGIYTATMPRSVEYMVRAVSYTTGQEGLPTVVKVDLSTTNMETPLTTTNSFTGKSIKFPISASTKIKPFFLILGTIAAVTTLLISMIIVFLITRKLKQKNKQ